MRRVKNEDRKKQGFLNLAKLFRKTTNPKRIKQLGTVLGRMIFG